MLVLDLVSTACTYSHIRFRKQRIAGIHREAFHGLYTFGCLDLASRTDTSLGIEFLHFRFFLECLDAVQFHARRHVEVRAQPSVHG